MIVNKTGFINLEEEELVWKKLTTRGGKKYLVQCLLPKGTECYIGVGNSHHSRKCRANQMVPIAFYESAERFNATYISRYTELKLSSKDEINHEGYGSASFTKYVLNKMLKPRYPFSRSNMQCASGMHFFTTPEDALSW